MRYTERIIDKYGEENIFTKYIPDNQKLKDKKLCQFEDIEEEFEIDSMDDLRDRLTKYKFLANHEMSCVDVNSYNLMLEDLNKYHSIEEELGLDLLTLIRALKNGIYVKNRKNEIRRVSCNIGLVETGGHNSLGLRFQDTNYKWRYLVLDTSRDNDLKDYGKTWALTKEEL